MNPIHEPCFWAVLVVVCEPMSQSSEFYSPLAADGAELDLSRQRHRELRLAMQTAGIEQRNDASNPRHNMSFDPTAVVEYGYPDPDVYEESEAACDRVEEFRALVYPMQVGMRRDDSFVGCDRKLGS